MGTLFCQDKRHDRLESVNPTRTTVLEARLEMLGKLATKYRITLPDAIALFSAQVSLYRAEAYVQNGDVHDEQMAGFGELLETFTASKE